MGERRIRRLQAHPLGECMASDQNQKFYLPAGLVWSLFFTARKRSLCYVFTPVCQSFCSQEGSASVDAGIADPPGPDTTPTQEQTRPLPRSRHPHPSTPPAQCMLGDTANKRAVRILMECTLVNCTKRTGLTELLPPGQI